MDCLRAAACRIGIRRGSPIETSRRRSTGSLGSTTIRGLVPVNWRDMETEELGSVYESLLELTPQLRDQRGSSASTVTAATRSIPRIACNAVATSASDHSGTLLLAVLARCLPALWGEAH